jgi:hypothetical protein
MRIVAFITDPSTVRDLLAHLGEPTAPPRIAPARGPPLWAAAGAEHHPSPDAALPPTPAYEFDPRIAWSPGPSTVRRLCAATGGRAPAAVMRDPRARRRARVTHAPRKNAPAATPDHPVPVGAVASTRET